MCQYKWRFFIVIFLLIKDSDCKLWNVRPIAFIFSTWYYDRPNCQLLWLSASLISRGSVKAIVNMQVTQMSMLPSKIAKAIVYIWKFMILCNLLIMLHYTSINYKSTSPHVKKQRIKCLNTWFCPAGICSWQLVWRIKPAVL